MGRRALITAAMLAPVALLLFTDPDANADPFVPTQPLPGNGAGGVASSAIGGGIAGEPGIGGGPNLSPIAGSALFLCPGVGMAVNILGAGGGYCDFEFQEVRLPGPPGHGTMHTHCEFGGFAPVAATWQCWRVFPGQPDHPAHPDPDIIPDGWMVPWALTGPNPGDQWPPPGLTPAPPPP